MENGYQITYKDKTFPASEYQTKIFDHILNGTGNLLINACAGSSKTTTIVNCLDKIEGKRVLFVAFNRSIVKEIRDRIGDREGINITTFHGLGFSLLAENLGLSDNCVDDFKYINYIKGNIEELSPTYSLLNKLSKAAYINNVIRLTDYFRYFLANKKGKMRKIMDKYDVVPLSDEIDTCIKVLKWGRENTDKIDYTDMVWLPNVLNLTTRRLLYDWVFIDEGQDTSIAEQRLVERCYRRGARYVVVGDRDQQINVWAGADDDAFDNFANNPNTVCLDLPICYRCPKKVIDVARRYSDRILPAPDAADGIVGYDVSKNDPVSGDMVLCRMTAPLVHLQLNYIRLNKKSYIKGAEDLRQRFLTMIDATESTVIDPEMTRRDGLFARLYGNLADLRGKIGEKYGISDDDAVFHPEFLQAFDTIEAIRVMSEGLTDVSELREKTKMIFNEEDEGIILSTVHKAKGLEADNVYILYPSLMPSMMAKKEWERRSENNLLYVASTRAKKGLYYMEESGRWNIKAGYMNPQAISAYINDIVKKFT